jgi:hypothetical protein
LGREKDLFFARNRTPFLDLPARSLETIPIDISKFHFILYHGATVLLGKDLLIVEDSRSHTDTPNSVGLLWTSDQPDAETST